MKAKNKYQQKINIFANISCLFGSLFVAQNILAAETAGSSETPPEIPAQAGAEADFASRDGLTGEWWGVRKDLENRGLTLNSIFAVEISKNFRGGLNTERFTGQYLYNLSLSLNLEKMVGLPGGEAFVNFQQFGGADPSSDVGDAQTVSSLSGGDRTQLSEVWYKQSFFPIQHQHQDHHEAVTEEELSLLWVKVGKIDVNSDFAFLESTADFHNGGMGLPVTDGLLPTYPDSAFGAEVFLTPVQWFYIGGGVFDGSLAEGMRTGLNGPKSLFASPSDLYMIGEIGGKWDIKGYAGTIKSGLRYNNGSFTRYDGSSQSGSFGGYVLAEQQVWKLSAEDDKCCRAISLFGGFDWADEDVSVFGNHYTAGLSLRGPFDFRSDDIVGLGYSTARFSRAAGSGYNRENEQAIEAFYKVQITPWLSVKPDLQYIINPGGAQGVGEALTATVRVEVVF